MPQNRQQQGKRGPNRGSWRPGQSGNPSGRPREAVEVRDLARQHTEEAIRTLVAIMQTGKPDRARAAAAEAILDRAWGRPMQPAELTGPGGVSPHALRVAQAVTAMTDEELHDFIRRMAAASQSSLGNGKGEAREDG